MLSRTRKPYKTLKFRKLNYRALLMGPISHCEDNIGPDKWLSSQSIMYTMCDIFKVNLQENVLSKYHHHYCIV